MPQTSKETKNSLFLRKHVKQVKGLTKFDVELPGKITDYLDSDLKPILEMPVQVSEDAMVGKFSVYQKAKKMGEEFAREITS